MNSKRFEISSFKALDDSEQPGTFEAIVSVFGNVDRVGDRVEPGAFTESLSKGLPPIVWSHQWGVPPIGACLDARETDEGLYIKGRLFVADDEDSPVARQVYTAMKAQDGRGAPTLREFSFAYDVVEAGWIVENEEEIYSLKQLTLNEAGPCLKGVNEETRLIAVKSEQQDTTDDRPPRPSEAEQEKGNPQANPPKDGGEEPAARTPSKAYVDLRWPAHI